MTISCDAGLVEAAGAGLLTVNDPVPWLCKSDALRATCNPVVLTTVVGRAAPFHSTTEFDSNPVPVIVIVAALPGATYRGEIDVMTGAGLFTGNATAVELPPPGAGLCTEIWLAELPVRSAAGTVAFTSVALTKVLASVTPFHAITEVETNPDPVTSTKVSVDPASTLVGSILAIVGTGLFTAKSTAADVPPPGDGLTTVNFAIAAVARLLAGRVAFKLVAELYVVAIDAPFH